MRPLRPVHGDMPLLSHAGRRARQPARADLSHQVDARRHGHAQTGAAASRPLPVLLFLHDDLSERRRLHAPIGIRPPIYRDGGTPDAPGQFHAQGADSDLASSGPVPDGASGRARRAAFQKDRSADPLPHACGNAGVGSEDERRAPEIHRAAHGKDGQGAAGARGFAHGLRAEGAAPGDQRLHRALPQLPGLRRGAVGSGGLLRGAAAAHEQ